VPTSLTFQPSSHYKLVGKAKESGEIIKVFDKVFEMNLTKFKHKAVLTQRIEVSDPSKPVSGYLGFMVCNDEMCLPPRDVDFTFKLPALANCGGAAPAADPVKTQEVPSTGGGDGAQVSPQSPVESPVATSEGPSSGTEGEKAPDDPNFKGFFYFKTR
jgi:hypothetical protein